MLGLKLVQSHASGLMKKADSPPPPRFPVFMTVGILTLTAVLVSIAVKTMKHRKAQKRAWSAERLMREAQWAHEQQKTSDDQVRRRRTAKATAVVRRAAEKTEREEREKAKKVEKKRNKGKLKKEAEQKKGEDEKEAKQQSMRRKWSTLAGMAMQHHAAEQRNAKQARHARRHARREAQRQETAAAGAVAAEAVTAMEEKASEIPNDTGVHVSNLETTHATTAAPTTDDSECVYCMDAQKEAVCVPCGHRGCMNCLTVTVDALKNGCPTCRAACREIIRLY